MTEDELLDWPAWAVLNIKQEGDCLIWLGEYEGRQKRCFYTRRDGVRINVKSVLFREDGDTLQVRRYYASCGVGRCVASEHQEWTFRAPRVF